MNVILNCLVDGSKDNSSILRTAQHNKH